jgi:hypothetical protein
MNFEFETNDSLNSVELRICHIDCTSVNIQRVINTASFCNLLVIVSNVEEGDQIIARLDVLETKYKTYPTKWTSSVELAIHCTIDVFYNLLDYLHLDATEIITLIEVSDDELWAGYSWYKDYNGSRIVNRGIASLSAIIMLSESEILITSRKHVNKIEQLIQDICNCFPNEACVIE